MCEQIQPGPSQLSITPLQDLKRIPAATQALDLQQRHLRNTLHRFVLRTAFSQCCFPPSPPICISGDLSYFTLLSKFKQPLSSNPQINNRSFFFFFLLLRRIITGILEVQVVLASDSDFIDTMMFMQRKAILGHVYDFVMIFIC